MTNRQRLTAWLAEADAVLEEVALVGGTATTTDGRNAAARDRAALLAPSPFTVVGALVVDVTEEVAA